MSQPKPFPRLAKTLNELIAAVPADWPALRQWVVWRLEGREGRWTKVPINPHTGGMASTTNPESWGTLSEAFAWHDAHPESHGVGIVLTKGWGVVGVDLDHCVDGEGSIAAWATKVITGLPTYAEISPSGTGVKLLAAGPPLPKGTRNANYPVPGSAVEMYSDARYFTVTGDRLPAAPRAVVDCTAKLQQLYKELESRPKKDKPRSRVEPRGNTPHVSESAAKFTDDELLDRARRAANGEKFVALWEGRWNDSFGSQSEADLALCSMLAFYTGADAARIDRLFRRSGLCREKWEIRKDYRETTIAKALEGKAEFWTCVSSEPTDGADSEAEHATDLGNARVFIQLHGDRVLYCEAWRAWLYWDDRRWNRNADQRVVLLAKEVPRWLHRNARALFAESLKLSTLAFSGDPSAAEKSKSKAESAESLKARANRVESRERLVAMLDLAKSERLLESVGSPPVPQIDLEPHLFNVRNGTLDLRTGQLLPHRPEDRITKLSSINYDPEAKCPVFDAFLLKIMADRRHLAEFVVRLGGLSLTGEVRERLLPICYGTGANGKTKLLEAIARVAGEYGGVAPPELLLAAKGDRHPTEIAALQGKRFVYTTEPDQDRVLAEATVKRLTGGDRLSARGMKENFWEFDPTHKIWLAANHKPVVRGADNGIWDRIALIPFEVRFWNPEKGETGPEELRQNKALTKKLRAEAAGILARLVRGAVDYYREGLQVPAEVRAATDAYRIESDVVARWVSECVDRVESDFVKTSAAAVQASFSRWHRVTFGKDSLSENEVSTRLESMGFSKKRYGTGNFYRRLQLREETDDAQAM